MKPELFEIELINSSKPVAHYVAGETITGVVHVVVGPSRLCKCTVVYRHQDYGDQYDITTICSVEGQSVEPGKRDIWTVNDFAFPPKAPTSIISHRLEIQYLLQIEMHLYGSANLKHEIPILIGTVPLGST